MTSFVNVFNASVAFKPDIFKHYTSCTVDVFPIESELSAHEYELKLYHLMYYASRHRETHNMR